MQIMFTDRTVSISDFKKTRHLSLGRQINIRLR